MFYSIVVVQISQASLMAKSSYIAKPAASWLDDFLIWLSPDAFSCCRKFVNESYCPPDDQVLTYSNEDFPCSYRSLNDKQLYLITHKDVSCYVVGLKYIYIYIICFSEYFLNLITHKDVSLCLPT